MTFFFVEEGVSENTFLDRRRNAGITWDTYPALSVVTPNGRYYPVPESVSLGNPDTAYHIMEEHLLNFTKGILPQPSQEQKQ